MCRCHSEKDRVYFKDFEGLRDKDGGSCHFFTSPAPSTKILFPFIGVGSVVTFFLFVTHF